jgi:hypothetical protein
MESFKFTGLRNGQKINGDIEADNEQEAFATLELRGIIVTTVVVKTVEEVVDRTGHIEQLGMIMESDEQSHEAKWYYARPGGKAIGPVSLIQLRSMLSAEEMARTEMVRHEGMNQWAVASAVNALGPMPPYPIARCCPRCGDDNFKKFNPKQFVIVNDRICNTCGSRYTPPTPRWEGILMLIIGAVFFLIGAGIVIIAVMHNAMSGNPSGKGGDVICSAVFMGIGACAFVAGIRSFSNKPVN